LHNFFKKSIFTLNLCLFGHNFAWWKCEKYYFRTLETSLALFFFFFRNIFSFPFLLRNKQFYELKVKEDIFTTIYQENSLFFFRKRWISTKTTAKLSPVALLLVSLLGLAAVALVVGFWSQNSVNRSQSSVNQFPRSTSKDQKDPFEDQKSKVGNSYSGSKVSGLLIGRKMAWRSSGATNAQLINNLRGKKGLFYFNN